MTTMHAVEITNGQHAPVRGSAEIMYAAYQLHVWLKTVKIAKVYLVQRLRLTGDCSCKTESRNDFIRLTFRSEKSARELRFLCRKAVFTDNKLVESCAITT
jgi:hypothetical protein